MITTHRAGLAAFGLLLGLAACGSDTKAAETTAAQTAPPTAAADTTDDSNATTVAPTTAPQTTQAPTNATLQAFSDATDKGTSAARTVPGTAAYTYAEGVDLLSVYNVNQLTDFAATVTDKTITWTYSSGSPVVLSDFVMEGDLIRSFSRNGVSIDMLVVPVGQTWQSGPFVGTLHSIRYFDGGVQLVSVNDNTAAADGAAASLSFDTYVAGGRQFANEGYVPQAEPTAKTAGLNVFTGAPHPGKVSGWVFGADNVEISFDVP